MWCLAGGGDGAEEAVRLVVCAGGEEQRARRPVVGRAVAELERPEAVDHECVVVGPELTVGDELPVLELVGVDLPVAEVADEQVA